MRERNEMVLADLIQIRAEQKPDLDVLTFEHLSLDGGATPDEVRSYADLATNGNRLAATLVARGMERGDCFALMLRNHPEFVETMIAASITGCVFVPIDPRTRGEKLAYMLRDAGCRGVVCADYCLSEALACRDQNPDLRWVLALETRYQAADPRGPKTPVEDEMVGMYPHCAFARNPRRVGERRHHGRGDQHPYRAAEAPQTLRPHFRRFPQTGRQN